MSFFRSIGVNPNRLVLTFFVMIGLIFLLGIAFAYLGARPMSSFPEEAYKQFKKLKNRSRGGSLDLREIDIIPWDEFVVWEPYSDICDYGIVGYRKDGENCQFTTENECYILLLNNDKIVARIFAKVDYSLGLCTASQRRSPIPREDAVFQTSNK